MAQDGGCTTVVKYLKEIGEEYPFLFAGQKLMWNASKPYGACCEPVLADSLVALKIDRFSTVLFNFAWAAIGDPLTLAVADGPSYFAAGLTNDLTPAGWPAGFTGTESDNNLFGSGAPVDRGHLYLAFGMCVEFGPLVTVTGASPGTVTHPAWAYASAAPGGGGSYYERIVRAICASISIKMAFQSTAIKYAMGVHSDFPSMTGLSGLGQIQVGSELVGAYIPFQSVIAINARDESRKMTLNTHIDRAISVANDPNLSTQSALSAMVKIKLLGVDICDPLSARLCNVATGPVNTEALMGLLNTIASQNPTALQAAMAANPAIAGSLAAGMNQNKR